MESITETIKKRYSAGIYDRVIRKKDKMDNSTFVTAKLPSVLKILRSIAMFPNTTVPPLKQLGFTDRHRSQNIYFRCLKTGNHYMEDFGYAMEK